MRPPTGWERPVLRQDAWRAATMPVRVPMHPLCLCLCLPLCRSPWLCLCRSPCPCLCRGLCLCLCLRRSLCLCL